MLLPHIQQALRDFNVEPPVCRKVLLVDDEPDNLDVASGLLRRIGDVMTAESGQRALELLAEKGPVDVVVADQRMPGMTGIELLTRIAEESPDTVRIVLTGYSDVGPMVDAVNKGSAYRFLLKPINAEELRAVVGDALRLKTGSAALGRLVGLLADHRTQLDRTVGELQRSQKQLLAAERLSTLGRATSGIVHDLRNASAILHILLDLVGRDSDDPVILQAADDARASSAALVEMLEQIRDFARASSADCVRQATEMAPFVSVTIKLLQLEIPEHVCEATVTVDPSAHMLSIDHSRVRQAMMALMRNAMQACTPGGDVTLSVRAEPNGEAVIEVRDQGCGMDEITLSRACEPFYSAFDPPGLGLGLEVVRLAAEAHGGRLELQSKLNQGTRALLVLGDAVVTERK